MMEAEEKKLAYFITIFLMVFLVMVGISRKEVTLSKDELQDSSSKQVKAFEENVPMKELSLIEDKLERVDSTTKEYMISNVAQTISQLESEKLIDSGLVIDDQDNDEYFAFVSNELFDESQDRYQEDKTVKAHQQMGKQIDQIREYVEGTRGVEYLNNGFNKNVSNYSMCEVERLGLKFSCDLNWQELEEKESGDQIVLIQEPRVTMSMEETNQKMLFVSQLTSVYFQELNRYEKGFALEPVNFAGRNSVLVKAFSATNPQVRVMDYYFVRDNRLYRVNFSVEPKDEWESVKFSIKDVVDSFQSVDKYSSN